MTSVFGSLAGSLATGFFPTQALFPRKARQTTASATFHLATQAKKPSTPRSPHQRLFPGRARSLLQSAHLKRKKRLVLKAYSISLFFLFIFASFAGFSFSFSRNMQKYFSIYI
jgi:hypothetical protein